MAIFHILLANISQKNVLYDIVKQKHAFLSDTKPEVKKKKNEIFPKRLTHGFGPKMTIFPCFF